MPVGRLVEVSDQQKRPSESAAFDVPSAGCSPSLELQGRARGLPSNRSPRRRHRQDGKECKRLAPTFAALRKSNWPSPSWVHPCSASFLAANPHSLVKPL